MSTLGTSVASFLLKIAQIGAKRQAPYQIIKVNAVNQNFSIQDLDLVKTSAGLPLALCIALQQAQLLHHWFTLSVRQRLLHLCL